MQQGRGGMFFFFFFFLFLFFFWGGGVEKERGWGPRSVFWGWFQGKPKDDNGRTWVPIPLLRRIPCAQEQN